MKTTDHRQTDQAHDLRIAPGCISVTLFELFKSGLVTYMNKNGLNYNKWVKREGKDGEHVFLNVLFNIDAALKKQT